MEFKLLLVILLPFSTHGEDMVGGWGDPTLPEYPLTQKELSSTCRHKSYLPVTLFELDSCAWCYKYMPNTTVTFGTPSLKLRASFVKWSVANGGGVFMVLTLRNNESRILANPRDEGSDIWNTFVNEGAKKDWVDCCSAAKACCQKQLETIQTQNTFDDVLQMENATSSCPSTWDGWKCWDETRTGSTSTSYCPPYIYFHTDAPKCAIELNKECTKQGLWYRHPKSGEEWTDYSDCGAATVSIHVNRAYVLITAYSISIVALIPALLIFFGYKQLKVARIILHQNLFLSMLINGVLVILFKSMVMLNEVQHQEHSPINENSVGCRFLLILTKYSRMTNYMWMFCEGFYLHRLIAAAFAEQKSLLVFHLIGWIFPILPTCIYGVYRLNWANSMCWVVPEEAWEWVLNGPSLLSLILNSIFLINIIRVLVTKLRSTHAQEPSQYRKAVRATLVLLPLFGLHFLVTIYRPHASTGVCSLTEIYLYANDVLDGIQGFMVALIFCYFNGEVSTLLGRTFKRFRTEYFGGWGNRGSYRRKSSSRRRNGSKSVATTQVYSSVPASPESNCHIIMTEGNQSNSNLLSVNNGNKRNLIVVKETQGIESSAV